MRLPERLPIVFVAGGFYDKDRVTAEQFWTSSGVTGRLAHRHTVLHERPTEPWSWGEEADALTATIEAAADGPVAIIAGSNGCSAALRVTLERPELVARLMLCWPATANDEVMDGLARVIIADVHDETVAEQLLDGEPVRGVTRAEIATINADVAVYPCLPENKAHQRHTATDVVGAIPGAMLLRGGPDPIDTAFGDFADGLAELIDVFTTVADGD